jgi:hypothetical protein
MAGNGTMLKAIEMLKESGWSSSTLSIEDKVKSDIMNYYLSTGSP